MLDRSQEPAPRNGLYSPFWPLLALLLAVFISLGWEWLVLRGQVAELQKEMAGLEAPAGQARNLNRGLQLFMDDLNKLTAADSEARAIVGRRLASP